MNRRAAALEALQVRLGRRFADPDLLDRALTHSSVKGSAAPRADNERLEFLGDRVLGLAIADALRRRDPEAEAGVLSKRLHVLVSREACAETARKLDLGPALRLPGGETRRGGRTHETILADACEAVLAALFLEAGYDVAAKVIETLWRERLDAPMDLAQVNPKSAVQEWAAAARLPSPIYRELARSGPDHQPVFRVEVRVGEAWSAEGEGGSLQLAQKAAALALLARAGEAP
ncbi:MAG: ribonuclease III [Alphaproteobacteria bacterium]|nr:ribonuclease III [Alphaproteobacteria bacterium]